MVFYFDDDEDNVSHGDSGGASKCNALGVAPGHGLTAKPAPALPHSSGTAAEGGAIDRIMISSRTLKSYWSLAGELMVRYNEQGLY